MQTIVEPKQNVDKLWGKQRVKEDKVFRLMKYVLRVDHEGKVLLHNVVTGRLVVLDQDEAEMLDQLPAAYSPVMEQLVTEHYLVSEDYDEHQQVVNLRYILWKIVDANPPKEVTSYLILPTTACNAKCWYCYEKDITAVTMTEKTACDVVDFIERNCGGKPVRLWWFGGEPTLAANRIDQICNGLKKQQIEFFSDMTTNGYLFDEKMIDRAQKLWNMRQVNVSLDGTEASYNRIKAFSNVKDSPYQRMMHNVELMLKRDIAVVLRMNYDRNNWKEFNDLLKETKKRFPADSRIMVYPHQINLDYREADWEEAETWFNEKNYELTCFASKDGLCEQEMRELPSLSFEICGAANGKWLTITPQGSLVCCGEQLDYNQAKGDIWCGVTNMTLVKEWKQFADIERCRQCVLFPHCAKALHCRAVNRCYSKKCLIMQCTEVIHKCYVTSIY